MRDFDATVDLSFLVGKVVDSVSFRGRIVGLSLGTSIDFACYGTVVFRTGIFDEWCLRSPGEADERLVQLLGAVVTHAAIVASDELVLTFDGGQSIRVLDSVNEATLAVDWNGDRIIDT